MNVSSRVGVMQHGLRGLVRSQWWLGHLRWNPVREGVILSHAAVIDARQSGEVVGIFGRTSILPDPVEAGRIDVHQRYRLEDSLEQIRNRLPHALDRQLVEC